MNRPSQLEYAALGRQQADTLLTNNTPLGAGASLEPDPRLVQGYAAVLIYILADTPVTAVIRQACIADGEYEQVFAFTSQLVGTRQVLAERFAPTGPFIEVEITNTGGAQTLFNFCLIGLPVGPVPDSNNGTGSPGGPGNTIVTKADLVIPAATNTPALLAADIPVGTRRVSIINVGANPVRLKAPGEGGGATRGGPLVANQSITIGDLGGSIAPLDAFSTLGTTLAFFFERN